MITTNDNRLDKSLRMLREHGMSRNAFERENGSTWDYDVVDLGYNYRLTDPQAALGVSQLKRVEDGIDRRIRIAGYYDRELRSGGLGIVVPNRAHSRSHIFHLYTIKVPKSQRGLARNELFKDLAIAGIQCGVHYTPLHLMTFYKQFLHKESDTFPVAEKVYNQILSLPLYPTLTKKKVIQITSRINDFVRKFETED
jgi:perosamine synthetase